MSFTYMRNCKGPKMDSCGTPHVILEGSEWQFSKFTLKQTIRKVGFVPTNSVIWGINSAHLFQ